MSISKYLDEKDQKEYFKVRVSRRSSLDQTIRIDRMLSQIKTLAEAERAEKRLIQQTDREVFEAESRKAKWGNLVQEWELAVRNKDIFTRGLGANALSDYYNVLKVWTKDWMNLRVNEIDKAKAWRKLDQVDRELSISRRKRLRCAIDTVFKWAILSGRIPSQGLPTEGYTGTKQEEEKMPEILNLEEIRLLLKLAKEVDHPWYPAWAMALLTGMRSGELYALQWNSIDFENKMIYVHQNWTNKTGFGPTKGRYWRAVPLSDHLCSFLKEHRLKTNYDPFVLKRFKIWQEGKQATILRDFCVGHGLPSVKFHTLRSCFGTQLIKDGIAPAIVMKICGWKDLKTMQGYIRLAGIEVKGALDGLKLLPEDQVMGRVVNLFEQS